MRLSGITQVNSEEQVYRGRLLLDAEYNICNYNQTARELLGSALENPFYEIGVTPESKQEIIEFLEEVKASGNDRIIVVSTNRTGNPIVFDVYGEYLPEKEFCYRINLWDISTAEVNCASFHEKMGKYRVILGMTNQIFLDYDMKANKISIYRYITRKSIRLFLDTFEVFESRMKELAEQTEKNLQTIEQLCEQLKAGKNNISGTVKTGMLQVDGKIQKIHIKARYDDMDGHRMMFGLITNMSETEEDLPYYLTSAGLDSATGLLSKRSLIEYTDDILTNPANASRVHYMVVLDIDDFKNINDNYGHQAGDKAILLLASTLMDIIQDEGIIGRFGGDEFYILTDRIENEDKLRSRLRLIKNTFEAAGREELGIEKMSLSMGVSKYPENGKNYNDLFALADKCLYIAKEKGKNRYIIYRPEMHADIQTGANRKGISSYDEQSKATNQIVREFFVVGRDAIEGSFAKMAKAFDLDSIDVFDVENDETIYSFGKYASNFECRIFTDDKKYMDQFDDNEVYVLNNHTNYIKTFPALFDYLQDKKCFSLIQVAFPSADKPKYLVSFNIMNHIHKWSAAEISNLGLYGTLICELLKR